MTTTTPPAPHTGTAGPRHLKVCGARTRADVALLADHGATLAGLWYGIPGGPADLTLAQLAHLAAAARDQGIEPTLVTFLDDPARLAAAAASTGIRWIQLHAYQSPAVVRALRAALPDAVLLKVLHLQGATCLERPLIGAYQRAGTDLFLLDTATADGRVGSTGQRLDPAHVLALLPRLERPFLLAGGLTPDNHHAYRAVTAHPLYRGADIDTAARDATGRFTAAAVTALARTWHREELHA
ncbi:N-(5'-phosphoribosyl)anthranilate isomerase [Kitasatospora sp. NPDC052868]|uniref:phosphoribosylanthranilate isomerase n=1 Tax=Kitasatospora sp. NPDC052868 TaxID=3364060 RepID=UPI0037C7A950